MKALRLRLAVGLGLVLVALAGPVAADDQPYPHIHYRGSVFQSDGTTPFSSTFHFPPIEQMYQWGSRLAPPDCFSGGSGNSGGFSGGQYSFEIRIKDTPACVAAMQTFNPPASAFPDVTATGWVFRKTPKSR